MALIFLSAVLFYLSFPNIISIYGFWPCIWFFAVPLLLALRQQPLKKRWGYAAWWGFCAYGLMAQGLIRISPLGFLAFVAALTVQAVFFACFLKSTRHPLADVFYFPFLWCISEFFRNHLLEGFSFYISHAHAFCPLMLASYGGLGCLGVSFIIFLVNSLICAGLVHRPYRNSCWMAAGLIFFAVLGLGLLRTDGLSYGPAPHALRVSIIQANVSPLEKMDENLFDRNAAIHLRLTEQSFNAGHPDLVIWPETAFPDDLFANQPWRSRIFAQAQHMNAGILLGLAPIIEGKEYNSALLINARGQMAGLYHKQALVPFVENAPFAQWGIPWGRGYHISPGNKPGIFALGSGPLLFGVVICSESAHPSLVRQLRRAGAKFLVEISNDGWFSDRPSYMLHAEAAVMRAVENHLWVIRAANTGFSFAVDPQGNIHTDGNLKLGREGYGIFDIIINNVQ